MRRLFLFAGYDAQNVVGESLLWHLRALASAGDIVFCADSDMPGCELAKLEKYTLHREAERHHEYDFGSYKRAFSWAASELSLSGYDFIYLVNDSVFGPLRDMTKVFAGMENMHVPAFAMVLNPHRKARHLQSWFIGIRPEVFLSSWFADFFAGVSLQKDKNAVCELYETGFTRKLDENNIDYAGLYVLRGKSIYNNVRSLYRKGLPCVKKCAFTRHGGSLGRQLRYVLDKVPHECREAVLADARRLYGEEYVDAILGGSSAGMAMRYLAYLMKKL